MKIYSNKRKPVKAGATLERENDMEIVLRDDDGAQLRVVYRPNVKGYVIRRTLNDGGNGRFEWDQSKEIYDTAEEAKQAALDGRVTFNFKGRKTPPLPVQSSTRRRSVTTATYNDNNYTVYYELYSKGKTLDATYDTEKQAYDAAVDMLQTGKVQSDIEIRKCYGQDTAKGFETVDSEWLDTIRYTNNVKASTRRRSVKASSNGWKETDYSVFMDGSKQRMSKYTKEYDGYRVMVRPEYNDKIDILSWVVYLFDINDEPKRLEAFETSYDAMDFADYEVYDMYVRPINSACHSKSSVKSSTRRRSVKCNAGKLDDIAYVMQNYINGNGFVLEQDLGDGKYVVSYQGTPVTIEFDPSFSEYVYFIDGEGPYSHNSYEYIYDDIREYVDSITDEWGNVIASANKAVKAAEINSDAYRKDMEQIQYYAQKVWQDIQGAATVFLDAREQFVPIDVPEVYGDEYFYEWYYQDYIDNFAEVHSKDADIDVSYSHNGSAINVSYGYFDSKELYNYGDDEEALCEFVQSFNSMEDLYFVTSEYGYTIADLANDPYAVFDAVYGDDEYEKANAAYEVRLEFDLWSQSDQVYDMTSDAQKFVDLYNEVADYFSYDNAERLLEEYNAAAEEY